MMTFILAYCYEYNIEVSKIKISRNIKFYEVCFDTRNTFHRKRPIICIKNYRNLSIKLIYQFSINFVILIL